MGACCGSTNDINPKINLNDSMYKKAVRVETGNFEKVSINITAKLEELGGQAANVTMV